LLEEFEGVVEGHRSGHGFVLREGDAPDIHLTSAEMRAVLHGDRVRVRVVRQDHRGRPEGHIVEILERRTRTIIGRLLNEDGVWLVAPEDKRYGQDILVPSAGIGAAKAGQIVVTELTEPPALYGQPVGRVTEVLGEMDDPGIEIKIAVREYGVPHEFSADGLMEAEALPEMVEARDKKDRVDLTDVAFVTIDGEDARDFDDAVYCQPLGAADGAHEADGWRLLVAIADVSHYVRDGHAIDGDAYERATSVYFPRRVIPMLPEKLSNGLCSLNPDVERLCMVCDMVVDGAGEVRAYQFYPAVIRSHARLTYTEVANALTNSRGPEAERRRALLPDLMHLEGVYRSLLQARDKRGAVDFDLPETQIICDEWGRITAIEPRERTEAHRIIEECMLVANVCAARFIEGAGRAALYRVHDKPAPDKLALLRTYLKALGVAATVGDAPQPRDFQHVAEASKDSPEALQIQTMLLRSMSQAVYTPENRGHFGLAYPAYTHFTSPIRRYPDLLVHRVIKGILASKAYRLRKLPPLGEVEERFGRRVRGRSAADGALPEKQGHKPSAEMERWTTAGLHCSACERRADEASRDVEAWLKCQYMRGHLGEDYDGTVSSVTNFGIFVTLNDWYVDGLVHVTELGDEYFRFDEARQELRGERTGMRYGIGTAVRVQVSRVNLDARQIDFRLLRDGVAPITKGAGRESARDVEDGHDRPRRRAAHVERSRESSGKKDQPDQARGAKASGKKGVHPARREKRSRGARH
jgi:ribonuclease R